MSKIVTIVFWWTIGMFCFNLLPQEQFSSPNEFKINLLDVLPIIDGDGRPIQNIPELAISEFSTPEEVFVRIRIVSASIYFHHWLNLITLEEAIVKLCHLYKNFPIYCEPRGYRQKNYTHCLDRSGKFFASRSYYQICPRNFMITSLQHQGKDLAFGADYLYEIFRKLDINLEMIPEYDDDFFHKNLLRSF